MPGGGGYLCSSRLEDSAMAREYYSYAGDLMLCTLILGKLISLFYNVCRAHTCTRYDRLNFSNLGSPRAILHSAA